MDYEWTFIDDVPLQILKYGSWELGADEKALFLIIPGNPGNMGFYEAFSAALFSKTKVPVWGISHTGHVTTPKKICVEGQYSAPKHPCQEDCGLWNQIQHKILFIKREVLPVVDKVFLIGHSIGCYIILHILDKMNDPKLHKGIMLFPTIERMAVSPEGKWITPLLVHGRGFIILFSLLLSYVPHFIKNHLVNISFRATNEASRNAVQYDVINPAVTNSVTYMGLQEMLSVDKRDDDIIKRHEDKLVFYYGSIDRWCPVSYYEDMKAKFENINIQLCKSNLKHAFVLRESEQMADILSAMFKSNFSIDAA